MKGAIIRALHKYNNKKIKESIPVDKLEADEEFTRNYMEYQKRATEQLRNKNK